MHNVARNLLQINNGCAGAKPVIINAVEQQFLVPSSIFHLLDDLMLNLLHATISEGWTLNAHIVELITG